MQLRRGLMAISAALSALVVGVSTANAEIGPPGGGSAGGSTGTAPSTTCSADVWKTPPRIVLHTSEYSGKSGDTALMAPAITDVVKQFNAVGGTSAKVGSVTTSTAPFKFGDWFDDSVPTIHVGFTSDIKADTGVDGDAATTPAHLGSDKCLKEMHIVFADKDDPSPDTVTWNFKTPMDSYWQDTYYDATAADAQGNTWFRPSFLHELLHAFALAHVTDQFSFMNHRLPAGFPWANRAASDSVRPLPWEIGRLRTLYPQTGTPPYPTHYDVAVLNNWYGAPQPDDDAASQVKLCTPSAGGDFTDPTSTGTCSTGGSLSTCAGDDVLTRFSVANYSTGSVHVSAQLYFAPATDITYKSTLPHSTDTKTVDLVAASSSLVHAKFSLPDLAFGAGYHPIIHIDAVHMDSSGVEDPATERSDWIPLRMPSLTSSFTRTLCRSTA